MVHEVLIALQTNLASRIALRYAEQLEAVVRFNMQAIHIPDLNGNGPSRGSGWVRKKWEKAVVLDSRDKIFDLIRNEYYYNFSDSCLKTVSGQRDQVILGELQERPYDFFIEGQLHAFEPDRFLDKMDSRLYRDLSCPVLLVKNLVRPDQGTLILVPEDAEPPPASEWLSGLLSGLPGELAMMVCRFDAGGADARIIKTREDIPVPVQTALPGAWKKISRIQTAKGSPESLAGLARNYSLVVSLLPQRRSPLARTLAAVPGAVLLCPPGNRDQEKGGAI